ncbi:unnamed protein product [Boreogadus saida]
MLAHFEGRRDGESGDGFSVNQSVGAVRGGVRRRRPVNRGPRTAHQQRVSQSHPGPLPPLTKHAPKHSHQDGPTLAATPPPSQNTTFGLGVVFCRGVGYQNLCFVSFIQLLIQLAKRATFSMPARLVVSMATCFASISNTQESV